MIKRVLSRFFGSQVGQPPSLTVKTSDLPEWMPVDGALPEGEWVQWKVGGGRFQVIPSISEAEYLVLAGKIVTARGPWARIDRHDGGLAVTVGMDAADAGRLAGHAPAEMASYERNLPNAMPRAAQVKGVLNDGATVRIVVSGLMPTAKIRRANGWEKAPPRSISLTQEDLEALDALISRLRAEPPLSDDEVGRKGKARQDARLARILDGQPIEPTSDGLEHFSLPEAEMRDYMRRADNDLTEQCKIIQRMLDVWFSEGMPPAPYYARRIAVILRKAKRKDLDAEFTAEWARHID